MLHRPLYRRKAGYSFIRSLNPAAWFRAGVGQTVTGSGVSTWADQSGNGRDLLQGTDAARPALQADGSVLFDGTADYLSCAYTVSDPITVYMAMKQVSWTSNDTFFGTNTNDANILQVTATPQIGLFAGLSACASSGLAVGAYGVLSAVFNSASSSLSVNLGAASTGNPGAVSGATVFVGSGAAGGANSNAQILEIILFSTAHDATQRARIIQYLAGRHGIAL